MTKELTPHQKLLVEEVMNEFDFNRVRRVMVELGWEWYCKGIPSIEDLRKEARRMLSTCIKKEGKGREATGGLCVV